MKKRQTGSVTGKSIKARDIVTGIKAEGTLDSAVLQDALQFLQHFDTGDVKAEEDLEASDVITGIALKGESLDQEALLAEMKSLREAVAELQKQPEAAAEAKAAGESLDRAIAEAEEEEPLGKMVLNRLRDTVEFLTDAGKLLEAADKAGPLVAKALGTAAMLYQVAGKLF